MSQNRKQVIVAGVTFLVAITGLILGKFPPFNKTPNPSPTLSHGSSPKQTSTPKCPVDKLKADKFEEKGKTNFNNRLYKEAIQDLNQAICFARNDESASSYGLRGQSYYALGKKQAAIDDYNQAINIASEEPWYAEYYEKRGDVYSDLGEKEKAISDYRKAIELYRKQTPDPDTKQAEIVQDKIRQLQK